jgi:flagellar hook-length control protein FliK
MTALTRIAASGVETLPGNVAAEVPVDATVFASLLASGAAPSDTGQPERADAEVNANGSAGVPDLAEQLLPLTDLQRAVVPVVLPADFPPDAEAAVSPDARPAVAPTVARNQPATVTLSSTAPGASEEAAARPTSAESIATGSVAAPVTRDGGAAAPAQLAPRETDRRRADDPAPITPRVANQGGAEAVAQPNPAHVVATASFAGAVPRDESAASPASIIKAASAQQGQIEAVRPEAASAEKQPAQVLNGAGLLPPSLEPAAETSPKHMPSQRGALVADIGGDAPALDKLRLAGPSPAIPVAAEPPHSNASVSISPAEAHAGLPAAAKSPDRAASAAPASLVERAEQAGAEPGAISKRAEAISVTGRTEPLLPSSDAAPRPFEPPPVLSLASHPPAAFEAMRAPAPTLAEALAARTLAARTLDLARDGAWVEQLARDIGRAAAGDGVMRLRLTPETLGELRIEISQSERGLGLRLTTTSEQAQAALAEAQPRLLAEARAQGLRVADAQVDLAGGQQQGREAQRQPQPLPEPAPRMPRREPSEQTIGAPARSRADRYA